MSRLIERFASTLGASQRAAINTLLAEGSIDGNVKSYEDFKAKLITLSESISLESTPLFTMSIMTGRRLITSASYNDWLRLIQLDLEAIYTELDSIANIVDIHRDIFDKKITDLKNSISTLDSKVSTTELLSNDVDYGLYQFNTFNGIDSGLLSKTDSLANTLYYDYRTNTNLSNSIYEVSVDATREGVILPLENSKSITIRNVVVVRGADTTTSDLDINPGNNELTNLLGFGDGLFWSSSILLLDEDVYGNPKTPPENGVILKLRIELSGKEEINSLVLYPFTDGAFDIESISYLDVDGGEFEILTSDITLNDNTTITFSRIYTDTIFLSLRQKTYAEIADFYYTAETGDLVTDIPEARVLITTSTLGERILAIPPTSESSYSRGYLYTIGFDYIGVNRSTFRDIGIFVSNKLSSSTLVTEAAVSAQLERSLNDIGNPLDSIEFYLAKFDYDNSGLLVQKDVFPVPYSTGAILHEALPLNVNVGSCRFLPILSSLKVYRDFTELDIGTGYTIATDGVNFATTIVDAVLLNFDIPHKLSIKILDSRITSVYTVSYTPTTLTAASDPIYMNLDRTTQFNGSSILFTYSPTVTTVRSDIYTLIVLRTLDYTSNRETPVVFEYSTKLAEVSSAI